MEGMLLHAAAMDTSNGLNCFHWLDPVVKHLSQWGKLSEFEFQLLRKLERPNKVYGPGSVLAAEGPSIYGLPKFLISGWACRQRLLADGGRQIFAFLLPGDIIGLPFGSTSPRPASVVALTEVTSVNVPLGEGRDTPRHSPMFSKAIDLAKAETEALLHDHVVRLGHMSGMERMAHLLLELHRRLKLVGLAEESCFPLPLSQEVLGDALGFTTVHINRTLQHLRREKLIAYSGKKVTLLDVARLTALGGASRHRNREVPFHTS